jgi:hypothetical protein
MFSFSDVAYLPFPPILHAVKFSPFVINNNDKNREESSNQRGSAKRPKNFDHWWLFSWVR